MDTSETPGAAIGERRKDLGLTQQQAAVLAGISSGTWSQLERGVWVPKRDRSRVGIAKALQWPADAIHHLLGETDRIEIGNPGASFRRRREHLGLTVEELSRRTHRSVATIRALETGRRVSNQTHSAVAWGLGWPENAYGRLATGESPETLEDATPHNNTDETMAALRSLLRTAGLSQMQVQVVEQVVADFIDDL